ncbi:T9SS type A sorting domain-containing protein [Lacinutrix sp. MEBiC02404]
MMKKLHFLIAFISLSTITYSQCPSIAQNACSQAAPTVISNSITCTTPNNNGGRRNFQITNMIAGATYRVSNCDSGLDTQMTIRNAGGVSVAYNDDNGPACLGIAASIDFTPPTTGNYRIQVNKYDCAATPNSSNGDIVVTLISNAPAPATNDEPCSAIALTINPDFSCTSTAFGTVVGASNSGINACLGTEDNDVWYSFVATNTSHSIDLLNITGSTTDMVHGVYGGFIAPDCSVAVGDNISCSDSNNNTIGGLTVGQTYFVQVYTYSNGSATTTFDICIGTPPPGPVNDVPCGAVSLTVNPDYSCTSTTSGTVASASNSGLNPCFGTADNDVWYSFVATNTSHTVDLLNISGFTDMYHAVYGGFIAPDCSVAAADNISCSDPNSSTVTSLTIGNTYFVQVYSYYSGSSTATFDVCIGTPPPPANNDEPCSADSLSVNPTCIGTTGTVNSATNSGIDSCFGTPDNDIWYSFVATDPSQTVSLFNISGSDTDMYHAIYGPFTPPDCSVAVADNISCNDGNSTELIGLTVGATYFAQVFTYSSGPETTSFEICITEPCTNSDPISTYPTLCPTTIIDEQGNNPFNPLTLNPSANLDCSLPTITLEVNSNLKETTSYIVEQITYPNPAPNYDFPILGNGTAQQIPTDDIWANTRTDLGFPFCFYNNSYTQTLIGANSMITFDNTIAPGSASGYSFSNNLPSIANNLFEQTIYGVYHDINPFHYSGAGEPIKSRTIGTTPCRQFQVSWHDVPMFSDNSILYTGMIVLHETTNIIEVFIEEKRIDDGNINPWNGGNAIVGIQGDITPLAPNNQYLAAPCRNGLDTNWETTKEAWRFTPDGAALIPNNVTWYSTSSGGFGGTSIGSGSTITVTTPDTYFAVSNYPTCSGTTNLTDEIIVNQSSKTWMGYIDNNWYVDGNWEPNGVPTPSDCVLIPDVAVSNVDAPIADIVNLIPLPPQNAYALNLTVASTASLEIASDTELVVTDWVHTDGVINIRNTGSLIQITDGAPNFNNNTGTGTINMQRTANIASPYDYIYWSSPVEGFGVSNVSPGSTLIYEWIPNIAGNGVGNFGNWQATTENMINGKGYIIRNVTGTPAPSTPEFVGKPNNGVITKAITRGNYNGTDYTGGGNTIATNLDDNWNLIGNPYPSAISADTFIAVNAAAITDDVDPTISGTVYLWRHLVTPSNAVNDPFYDGFVYNYNPNDYVAYNSTGSNPAGFGGDIAAGQAFFVLMEHTAPASSNVVFNNTMRSETLINSQFYRTDTELTIDIEKNRIWLDLISPDNTANSILVGYVEGATNALDRLFDGYELSETSTRFYSIMDDEAFAIQGKSLPFDNTDRVPLGVEINENGNYSIALNALDGLFTENNQAIYIEDTYTNIIHDLRVNPYSFNIDAGIYNDRFILRYTDYALSIEDYELSGLEILAPNNSFIKVKSGNSPISTIIVYDLLGRILVEKTEINASEISFNNHNFSEGTYMVKAILSSGKQKIQKVVLKH